MHAIRKTCGLLVAILLCVAYTLPAMAKASRVVSNIIIVMPPSRATTQPSQTPEITPTPDPNATLDPNTTLDPNATLDPEATLDPNAALDPNATVDPEASLEPESTEEVEATNTPDPSLETTDAPVDDTVADLPSDAFVTITATIHQQGDLPAYGDAVRLEGFVHGMDGFTYAMQWQQQKSDGQWVDLVGADRSSFTFVMTEENAHDAWRMAVTVFSTSVVADAGTSAVEI